MNLTPAAYSLLATLTLIAFTVLAFLQGWEFAYLIGLPASLCAVLLTGEHMVRYSRYNRS